MTPSTSKAKRPQPLPRGRVMRCTIFSPSNKMFRGWSATTYTHTQSEAAAIVRFHAMSQDALAVLEGAAQALEAIPINPDSVYWKYRQNQVNRIRRLSALLSRRAKGGAR